MDTQSYNYKDYCNKMNESDILENTEFDTTDFNQSMEEFDFKDIHTNYMND